MVQLKIKKMTKPGNKPLPFFWLHCRIALGVICTLSLTLNTCREAACNPERQEAVSLQPRRRKYKISDLASERCPKFRSSGHRSPCNQFEIVKPVQPSDWHLNGKSFLVQIASIAIWDGLAFLSFFLFFWYSFVHPHDHCGDTVAASIAAAAVPPPPKKHTS